MNNAVAKIGERAMLARIYTPAKTAMSSGTARTGKWVLEFEQLAAKRLDPLMGWAGSSAVEGQIKLSFPSKTAAIEYAKKHGLAYQVIEGQSRKATIRARGYGENFSYTRRTSWTH